MAIAPQLASVTFAGRETRPRTSTLTVVGGVDVPSNRQRPRCGPTKMNARGSAGFKSGCSLGACLIRRCEWWVVGGEVRRRWPP